MGLLRLANSSPTPEGSGGCASGQALLSMRGTWGAGRLNPSLLSSHQLPNSGGSPRNGALPRKSLLGELPLLPLLCVWQEGPGLRFLPGPSWTFVLAGLKLEPGQPATRRPLPYVAGGWGGGRRGGDVMNPWDLLLPLSYQQCCLPPVWVSFCECRAVSASRPLSAVLSPSASYQPRIPETLQSCR